MKMRSVLSERVKAYLILGFCVLGVVVIIAVPYFITLSSGFLVVDEVSREDEAAESAENTDAELSEEGEAETAKPSQTTGSNQATREEPITKPEQAVPEKPEEEKLNVDDRMSGDDGFTEVGPIENTDESAGEYTPGATDEKPEGADNPGAENGQAGEPWGI